MKTSVNNTTSRLILAPVALLVMVIVWMLAGWELGLGAAWLVVYLSPELMMIFSKRWRVLKAEEMKERRQNLEIWRKDHPGNYDYTPPKQKDDIFGNI